MAGKYSRFLRSGFIAVIAAVFQLQLFAEFPVPVQVNQIGSVNGTVSLTSTSPGGTQVSTHLSSGQSATIKAVPNNGYQFQKWTISVATKAGNKYSLSPTTADYQIKYDDFNSSYGSIISVQCTATFAAKEITVNFDAKGGTTKTISKTVTYDSTYGELPTPERSGYAFIGWYTAESGGTKIEASTTVSITSAQTLYAQWIAKTYTVTFNANGGATSTSSKEVTYASTYGNLPPPTRTGYTFAGWYTAENGGTKVEASSTVSIASAHTLYARWTANTYTVTFNANGGETPTESKSVTYDATYGDLPKPTRTGYTFAGWYTAKSGGTKIEASSTVSITSEQTLYARWTAKSYTVTFNANGGTVTTSPKSVTYASTYGELPEPTRTGYTFAGWYTAKSGGTKFEASSTVSITSEQTLYARWTAKTYTVTFNANDGSVSPTSKEVTYASTYGDLPIPMRTGYTFDGWYTSASGGTKIEASSTVSITSAQTLHAHWTAIWYGLGFDNIFHLVEFSKSSVSSYPADEKICSVDINLQDNSLKIIGLSDTRMTCYTARSEQGLGNYPGRYALTIKGGATYNIYAKTESNLTVIPPCAIWVFLFDAEGNYISPEGAWSESVNIQNGIGSLTTPSHAKNMVVFFQADLAKEEYLKFKDVRICESSIAADFNSQSGLSYAFSETGKYGTLPIPQREGYAFVEWNLSAAGNGIKLTKDDPVAAESRTVYSQWSTNDYTVTFNANGGETPTLSTNVTYGATYGDLPTPTRTGYTFAGWYTAKSGGEKIETGATVTITKNTTLYAQWSAISYTIAFNGNGATSGTTSSIAAKYGETYALTSNGFSRKYLVTYNANGGSVSPASEESIYQFAGWNTKLDGAGDSYSDGVQVNNLRSTEGTVTLYAKWNPDTVTLPEPTRTGYTFNGWYTATSAGTRVGTAEDVYTPIGDIELYARWSANTYYITFDANGGTCSSTEKISVTYDDVYPSLHTVTREGYNFLGWYTSKVDGAKVEEGNKVTITENTTLYALWEEASYTLTFDPDGGTLEGNESISVSFGGTYPVLPTASRTGYGFCGWYFGRNETGDELRAGDSVNITSNTTVYAGWTNNIYTVVYRRGEAYYGEDFSTNVYYDISFNLAKNPEGFECPGKKFAGWKLPDGTVQKAGTKVLNLAASGSVEVIATWKKPEDPLNASGICKNLIVTTSAGDQAWTVHEQDGVKCLKSGNVKGVGRYSKLESKLVGESGTIMFKWCYVGDPTVIKAFYIGDPNLKIGKEIDKKEHPEGFGNWKEVAYTITKDKFDSSKGCVTWQVNQAVGQYAQQTHALYIKDVVWIPNRHQSEAEGFAYTDETGVTRTASVPTSWVEENALLPSGSTDYRAALKALSGKKDSSGAPLSYWHDYIAGTDPKDPADVFKVTAIAITNGTIYLSWSPDLRAAPLPREYQILGKEKLTDPTWAPTNSATRFFRVDVHLKE
ncbi:MAG: InlB B-repeat-containing protein [Kiritimatiellae bacterium]|nr:InlB B-repeat-containing protein [Kiritimatiellia bacterium]